LTSGEADHASISDVLRDATAAPARGLAIDDIDRDGSLREAMGVRAGEAWLIRPDGHVAALVDANDLAALSAAVRRSLAL
jgi:pentachlorophenol monooxygenase/3-(3-hydroxy-phenyl)propionate hydroxylase